MRKGEDFQAEGTAQTKAQRLSEKEQPIQGTASNSRCEKSASTVWSSAPNATLMGVDVIFSVNGSHGGHWS